MFRNITRTKSVCITIPKHFQYDDGSIVLSFVRNSAIFGDFLHFWSEILYFFECSSFNVFKISNCCINFGNFSPFLTLFYRFCHSLGIIHSNRIISFNFDSLSSTAIHPNCSFPSSNGPFTLSFQRFAKKRIKTDLHSLFNTQNIHIYVYFILIEVSSVRCTDHKMWNNSKKKK